MCQIKRRKLIFKSQKNLKTPSSKGERFEGHDVRNISVVIIRCVVFSGMTPPC